MKLNRFFKKRVKVVIAFLTVVIITAIVLDTWVFPLPFSSLHKKPSTFVYDRNGQLMRCFISSDQYWRQPVKLDGISTLLVKSVLACEDRWFYYHPGVNVVSLISAAIDNIKAGKIVRGGSTITMQIARMTEPKPRTIKSKIVEIFRAFQLEFHFSKGELLEIYFNNAPYGGNIEGIGAASYFYFGKPPGQLTPAQAAMLTALPNSPTVLCPGKNIRNCYSARDRVLDVMLGRNIISEQQYREARLEKIDSIKTKTPFYAPHLCRDIAIENPDRCEIISTIDLSIQNVCAGILKKYEYQLKSKNISNAAVVVIDNKSSEILALVGSLDFFDNKNHGQINGALACRSPGSALKPFAYALAMEKGIVSPNMYLADLPVYYSGYSPQNYDGSYRGVVSVSDALRLSLNVPAVNVCAETGLNSFFELLKKGGISTLKGKYFDYGLPLVLGSCDIKLIELTNLYSVFANGGIYKPYKLIKNDSMQKYDTLFSTPVCYIIAEILAELTRPEFPSSWEFSANIPKIAWKTGTSYGRKDAWSIGFNPQYAIGVWAGNFSAEPSPELVGAETAAPILFDIFTSISSKIEGGWFTQPDNIGIRDVCSVSGKLPGPYCPSTIEEYYIRSVSPTSRCDIHQQIIVDSKSGYKMCRFCSSGKECDHKVYEIWPPEISTWFKKTGFQVEVVPQHNPDCRGTCYGDRPIINSPKPDVDYVIRTYVPIQQQGILLDASVTSGSNRIYWFVDGGLFGSVLPGAKIFYLPEPGYHNITCSDDQGRSSSITLKIRK